MACNDIELFVNEAYIFCLHFIQNQFEYSSSKYTVSEALKNFSFETFGVMSLLKIKFTKGKMLRLIPIKAKQEGNKPRK